MWRMRRARCPKFLSFTFRICFPRPGAEECHDPTNRSPYRATLDQRAFWSNGYCSPIGARALRAIGGRNDPGAHYGIAGYPAYHVILYITLITLRADRVEDYLATIRILRFLPNSTHYHLTYLDYLIATLTRTISLALSIAL